MSSTLYKGIRDIAVHDGTVYASLKTQEATGASDMNTAISLIRMLAKEKAAYMQYAMNVQSMSIMPAVMNVKLQSSLDEYRDEKDIYRRAK